MLCLWIDSQSSLTGLCRFAPGYPALERLSGKAARTLGVPGYFQTRLSALEFCLHCSVIALKASKEIPPFLRL